MTAESIEELKALITEIKDNMVNEKNCNDQLYTIIQTLDGIGTYIERLEQGETPKAEEYTVLQTNILEVRNELSKINKNVDDTILAEFKPLVSKLTEKVNRLDIIANNSGIDKQVLANVSAQIEQNLTNKLNENSEVLYNQTNTTMNMVKTDIETLNENLKDGVSYLEKVIKTTTGADVTVKSLSDDLVLLSTNIEKSNANLKKSVLDVFTRIQGSINSANIASATGVGVNPDALQENLEMLKNGLYNINVNSNQQFNKMVTVLSELETFKNLEKFAELNSLPTIGDLKNAFYTKLGAIINQYTTGIAQGESAQELTSDNLIQEVYSEFTSMLSNVSKYIEETAESENSELTISDKIDELLPFTKESVVDIKDLLCELKRAMSTMQSGDEDSDYTYSMQDIESDVAKIRIYLNELGQHINTLTQNDPKEEITNIYVTLDAINQKVSKNENFKITDNIDKIQEDVLSISTRVNTLLLSSEKDSETLQSSLDDFSECFQAIKDELNAQTKIEQYDVLKSSLDRVEKILEENKTYSELINQSLVMLAEWVDNAGETILSINNKLGKGIDSIVIPETIDYTSQIQALESRIEEQNQQILQQQDYIQKITSKLDTVLAQNERFSLQEEKLRQIDERMTTILEFSAKNDSSSVMDKMNSIDIKLEKLNNSIGKITSYVDEE